MKSGVGLSAKKHKILKHIAIKSFKIILWSLQEGHILLNLVAFFYSLYFISFFIWIWLSKPCSFHKKCFKSVTPQQPIVSIIVLSLCEWLLLEPLNDPLYSAPEVLQTSPLFLPFYPSGPPSFSQTLSIGVVLEWSIIIAQGNGPSWETFRELSKGED